MRPSPLTLVLALAAALCTTTASFFVTSRVVEARSIAQTQDTAYVPPRYAEMNKLGQAGEEDIATISQYELLDLQAHDAGPNTPVIVDIRSAANYKKKHISGSFNMSVDRLKIDLAKAASKDRQVVLFCNYNRQCEEGHASRGIISGCQRVARYVKFQLGYPNTMLLEANESELSHAGVRLAASQ